MNLYPFRLRFRAYSFVYMMAVLSSMLSGCDNYPKDPSGTLEKVRNGKLVVALLEKKPWSSFGNGQPTGVEVAVISEIASKLGAELVWAQVSGSDAISALAERRIDLLVGGITEDAVWKSYAAFTRPYLTYDLVVAGPANASVGDLKGQRVQIAPASTVARWLQEQGAIPVAARPGEPDLPLKVIPAWQLLPDQIVVKAIETERHVVAVPPGENAWLIYVDRHFASRRDFVLRKLREMAIP